MDHEIEPAPVLGRNAWRRGSVEPLLGDHAALWPNCFTANFDPSLLHEVSAAS